MNIRKSDNNNSAPASPREGDIWIDANSGALRIYDDINRLWRAPFLKGSKTQDWASVNDGAVANTTVTVTGAKLGDVAIASMNVTGGVPANAGLFASVTAADTVTVTLYNHTGIALDLASGTLVAIVIPT